MTGMDGALRRAAFCGALAVAVLLLAAASAQGARYAVAQCGWHIGQDANWDDTTAGAKFRPDSFCAVPEGQDPFADAHMKSFTRDGAVTVSGTRFARWRWDAPPGTGITAVRGTWWHALRDGLEHRLGTGGSGGFEVVAAGAATDTTPREFSAGFSSPRSTFESRLLCARGEDKSCSLDPGSFSSVRALTFTLEDSIPPGAAMGGQLLDPGWRRGAQSLNFGAADVGSGVRSSQTLMDGASVGITNYPCSQTTIGGELRGTRLMPCGGAGLGVQTIGTNQFSDGPHTLRSCATDFAGNVACADPRQILIDNNAPAAPRGLIVTGGDGWHRTNGFTVSWTNPDQGVASLILGASYRVTSLDGYDSGVKPVGGGGLASLRGLVVPRAGVYAVQVWLRDAAGNEDSRNSAAAFLRLDDSAPQIAFRADRDPSQPEDVRAAVADTPSGVASGRIEFRLDPQHPWRPLPTGLVTASGGQGLDLLARFPSDDVAPGTYEFQGTVSDVAGNSATTNLRSDGSLMTLKAPLKPRTRLTASLRLPKRSGARLTARFGTAVTVAGRLISADGRGIAGKSVDVLVRPARGSFAKPSVRRVASGPHGGFSLSLGAGTSRRIVVRFGGTAALGASVSAGLVVRVRSGVELQANPAALHTGESVKLTGRVKTRGAPVPRRGKLIAIQYLESESHRWRPVLVTRTNRSGHFHARYRFRYINGTAEIRFRAAALPEDAWPYASGFSPNVTVRVSG